MLSAIDLTVTVPGRTLVEEATFDVRPGDRVGLVGRNGAGKTTLSRVLAGELAPGSGQVRRSGSVAYLPQDSLAVDTSVRAIDRVLSGRGLDSLHALLLSATEELAVASERELDGAMHRYGACEQRFQAAGGWAGEAAARSMCSGLGLRQSDVEKKLSELSGGQRRRIELARALFSGSQTLILDEPTNHLDVDSVVWLKSALLSYEGALVLISHDETLLEATVNRVLHLEAAASELVVYNLSWRRYLQAVAETERRREKEAQSALRTIGSLRAQADRMRATATKARAAHQLDRRAERLRGGVVTATRAVKVAAVRFPEPAPCGRTPLTAVGLAKSYGTTEVFSKVDLSVDRGSRIVVLGLNGAGKTTLLRILSGHETPDEGEVRPGHGLHLGYFAQEHETLDRNASVYENLRHAASPSYSDTALRGLLGAFLFSGETIGQAAGTLSGGERTRLSLAILVVSAANVLLLDEPTNNLDRQSRSGVLEALRRYSGAIVLVTHDPGAVEALSPERVLVMPDGTEDFFRDEHAELVALA